MDDTLNRARKRLMEISAWMHGCHCGVKQMTSTASGVPHFSARFAVKRVSTQAVRSSQ